MKLHEAKLASAPNKQGLKHLMKFFVEENFGNEGSGAVFYVQENFIVRNTNVSTADNEVTMVAFPYTDTDMSDHALITYADDVQDDILIKDMAKYFRVDETRRVY